MAALLDKRHAKRHGCDGEIITIDPKTLKAFDGTFRAKSSRSGN
jgi:hypothetical protein